MLGVYLCSFFHVVRWLQVAVHGQQVLWVIYSHGDVLGVFRCAQAIVGVRYGETRFRRFLVEIDQSWTLSIGIGFCGFVE